MMGFLSSYCLPTPIRGGGLSPFASLYSSDDPAEEGGGGEEEPGSSSNDNDDDNDDDSEDEDEEEEGSLDEEQIPYDIRLDTMAYMTCNNGVQGSSRFTFKIGAFGSGGIKLKSPLLVDKSLADIKKYPLYRAEPFAALSRPNARSSIVAGAQEFSPISFHARLGLSSDSTLRTLAAALKSGPNSYLQELGGRHISIHHRMSRPHFLAHWFDQFDLIIGFRQSRTPHTYTKSNERYIHGRYYQIEASETEDEAIHVLSSIEEEYPKPEPPSRHTWSCPDSLQLKIMRHEDRRADNEDSCEDDDSSNTRLYSLVKRILKKDESDPDKWHINISQKCISPKRTSTRCYPNNVEKVEYSSCTQRNRGAYCPHYLSICIR